MAKQLELPRTRGWGGKRKGAGRKRAPGVRSCVPHRKRPIHKDRHPVHVVLSAKPGLPSFRQQSIHRLFAEVLRDQRWRRYKDEFRLVHFSIQRDHLHLIVESDSKVAAEKGYASLRAGISGLAIAFARRLNMMLGRRGSVWADRYFRRDLKTPRQASYGLAYVFANYTHHGAKSVGDGVTDPHSSAWLFDGWDREPFRFVPDDEWQWPVCPAQTWLLTKGYALHGPLPLRPTHASLAGLH